MKLLQFRALIFLSLLYLCLVALLYHILWRKHTLEKLFDTPGHQVSVSMDYSNTTEDHEVVQFNFKRLNPIVKGGSLEEEHVQAVNHSLSSTTSGVLIQPHSQGNSGQDISNKTNIAVHLNISSPNYHLHAFYYLWFGNVTVDGSYIHWNHRYLPHWDPKVTKKYPTGRHQPPDDIGASFYPKLGCYSSKDEHTIEAHMQQLQRAGVGVVAVSWYPANQADDEGVPPDLLVPRLLDAAHKYAIMVAFHIEPYHGRTPLSVRNDLQYIHQQYSEHPAVYKLPTALQVRGKVTDMLPVVYIYDSYLSPASEWGEIFKTSGRYSVRDTYLDCIAISLLVELKHKKFVLDGGFDGFYTYFASDGFSYGSSTRYWSQLSRFAKDNRLLFIPSVGPGYDDSRVRPWNYRNSKPRNNGHYYRDMFESALTHNHGGLVSITSFNEWHEGTQIESAVPKETSAYTYLDYSPNDPEFYLDLTNEFSQRMELYNSEDVT